MVFMYVPKLSIHLLMGIGLFPDTFVESTDVFIEHLLCTRPWTGYKGHSTEQTKAQSLPSWSSQCRWETVL